MKRTVISLLAFLLVYNISYGQLVINEIMQSNIDCVMDDLNEFPGYRVEPYNNSEKLFPFVLLIFGIALSLQTNREVEELHNKNVGNMNNHSILLQDGNVIISILPFCHSL